MATTLLKYDLPEEIYKKSKSLNKDQILQVLDFMEFLKLRGEKSLRINPFIDSITAEADPDMTLKIVREQISSIKGNLADTIIKGREERL